jgi:hypothetical protein
LFGSIADVSVPAVAAVTGSPVSPKKPRDGVAKKKQKTNFAGSPRRSPRVSGSIVDGSTRHSPRILQQMKASLLLQGRT